MSISLLLGGARAGKSARALQVASAFVAEDAVPHVTFVATAQAFDDDMERRISAHRAERDPAWQTIEEPIDLAGAIARHLEANPDVRVVVIDCLTLWVSNLLLQHESHDDIEALVSAQTRSLLDMMRRWAQVSTALTPTSREWICVSNEVGLGVVPPSRLGRQYRDALGRANQLVAAAAADVRLLVAGLEMPLKTRR